MQVPRRNRKLLRRILLGKENVSQRYHLALREPQAEVDVWLHGAGDPIDVTHIHLMACGAPLTICIGFAQGQAEDLKSKAPLTLRFQEHAGSQRLLGEIVLQFAFSLLAGGRELCLFYVAGSRNLSLPRFRFWIYSLFQEYGRRRFREADAPITAADSKAMTVFYLCPRATALVTVGDENGGNLFPMNLMGWVGGDTFAFGLNSSRSAAPLVEQARRVVLSSFPQEQLHLLPLLGKNHRKSSIDWNQLPFPIIRPRTIHAPVPAFAQVVREMQVVEHLRLGSHTLFVAKMVAEEELADGPRHYTAHGMYGAWKRRSAGI